MHGTIGVSTKDRISHRGGSHRVCTFYHRLARLCHRKLLPSQSRTKAVLVAAAVHTERPNLASSGRQLAGHTTADSAIKRAWRFTDNHRVNVADAMAGVLDRLVRNRKKRLLVSFDRTEFRQFHALLAAACIRGRAVPLLWASYPQWKLLRSQNTLEEGLLRSLRTLVPESVDVVILADRGFGRAEWAAVCQELGSATWYGSSRR
jgi:hypothetical protein